MKRPNFKSLKSLAGGGAAVALSAMLATTAFASGPGAAQPSGAPPLTGTVSGSLSPGQVVWYAYWHEPTLNDAITLKANPAVAAISSNSAGASVSGAYFNVDWLGSLTDPNSPGGVIAPDVPGYLRVAQSSQSGLPNGDTLPAGTQFWEQDKSPTGISYVNEVVNPTDTTVQYALTLEQSNDAVSSADALAAPAPGATTAPAASAATAAPAAAQPTAAAPAAAGSLPSQAAPLSGTATGSLAPGQAAWYTYWHDPSLNDAITLRSNPPVGASASLASGAYDSGVFFNVDWLGSVTDPNSPGGVVAPDAPGYVRVAQSAQSGLDAGGTLPTGTQFWQQNKSSQGIAYTIQVVNNSGSTIQYALTLQQSNDSVSSANALSAPTP